MVEKNEYTVAISEIDPYEIECETISLEPSDEPKSRSRKNSRREVPNWSNDEVYDTYGYNVYVKGSTPNRL